jgi:SRSO17 transposase
MRRNRSTGELAYYRCYSPASVPLTVLVRVAGSRWRVEELFQSGKGLAALDEHQVRRCTSWSRWVTLVVRPVHDTAHRLGWSNWRRRHQVRSQAGHHRRQSHWNEDHELRLEY